MNDYWTSEEVDLCQVASLDFAGANSKQAKETHRERLGEKMREKGE